MIRKLSWLLGAVLVATAVWAASRAIYDDRYARDRAEIEDLQGRYLFALDWQDPELYASTFTEDGVLVWAGGTVNGRAAIVKEMQQAREADARAHAADAPLPPFKRRHYVSNLVLRVDGDRATARAFWFEFNNDGADRKPYVGAYGHYEDALRRVDGRWLFERKQIFNEQRANMASPARNPAW
jgi:SnoaL-like domain